jgi:chromosome segregation ATPase
MFLLFLSEILANASNNGALTTWIAAISGAVATIIAGILSWRTNKNKNKNDEFVSLLEQSAEFRNELRKDRDMFKEELKEAREEVEAMRRQIADCEEKMIECKRKLEECREHTQEVLQELKKKV